MQRFQVMRIVATHFTKIQICLVWLSISCNRVQHWNHEMGVRIPPICCRAATEWLF